jgi:hypothetical protein
MDNLPARQQKLIISMLSHSTVEQAYEAVQVSRSTCYRWLQDEKFASALEKARSSVVNEGLAALKNSTGKAVQTLTELLDSDSEHVRLKASEALLKMVVRIREVKEVEDRLEGLERIILERRIYKQ